MDDQFDPPAHLTARTQALWRSVVPKRAKTPERLAMLQTSLEALDRADGARAEVERTGMTTTTKTTGAVHLHPLLKVERESRQLFSKLWKDLGLHTSPEDPKWNVLERDWR
ncbi:hypothetical protein NG895_12040 [Aeoliella sp. ICT_H6.2]|uniref:Uncharacterized protein n=1 Tax=Aeoliella straminimaris TaxID=2954799 RepID=A0A9X2JHH3_9BACT|nr:P27 family phage terminase small subunit [Aeoliella straminimaris]MCO6044638.1 hypothetical protein [Aeoliella straminimaris]